jgi:murein tripeptide amidase MpaA
MTVSISVSDAFDGGNIKFITQRPNPNDARILDVVLHIKPDPYTELEKIAHMQYFSFRVTIHGITVSQRVNYVIENANTVSYPEAWTGTTVFYSDDVGDSESWRRNQDTFYMDGKLSWEHLHTVDCSIYFSYFPPFSYERHLSLISKCAKYASVRTLGQSLDGREIECVSVGTGSLTCWIIHRQHPGETMAEFYAEGLLTRLLGLDTAGKVDDQVATVLKLYTFYVVPCMCPDGSVRGHLRTNACGANLNREWTTKGDYEAPTLERSPEVYAVLNKMDETGVDVFLDIHGDEELPYNFICGATHIPQWGPRLKSLHGAFTAAYSRANSDIQQKIGYPPPDEPESVLNYMNVATNQISNRFNCLGLTLEMPFKDCLSNSDPQFGWTPARSGKLGASVLDPLEYIHPYLRAEGEFWTNLPPEDAYVKTTDDYKDEENAGDDQFIMLHKRLYSDVHEFRKQPPVVMEK